MLAAPLTKPPLALIALRVSLFAEGVHNCISLLTADSFDVDFLKFSPNSFLMTSSLSSHMSFLCLSTSPAKEVASNGGGLPQDGLVHEESLGGLHALEIHVREEPRNVVVFVASGVVVVCRW